ncbi:MAG: GspE/PulE family protein [Dethiobacteria bacterium]|jgi:type IV pilus assembly protein PilB|nr:type II/IV secretion system protein [Bacillota bacterium]
MTIFYHTRVGNYLMEAGVISKGQLNLALKEQRLTKKRLGQILVEKGFVTEEKFIETLEKLLGIPYVNLYSYDIDPEVATSIPAFLARRHHVIPIQKQENKIILAMADPLNVIAIDDVAMSTGAEIETVISTEKSIDQAIDQFFGLKESMEETLQDRGTKMPEEDEAKKLEQRAIVEEAPIVRVVNSIIHQAVSEGASDIHIEPLKKGLRIRMRIDGVLHELMKPPKDAQPLIISRIKIMAGMDIAERRLPQDGRFQVNVGFKEINIRVSALPTIFGEKIVLRILDKERIVLPLGSLGFNSYNEKTYRRFIENTAGMVLVTGPAGCGKTTTLYSTINYLNALEKNIITAEDPVEYHLDGINQVQVNSRIGLSFAAALRTILRQDPNVIMVGEIRDRETAEIATRAALTGHLVFSTLHTNDAPRAISRLLDMGVESFLIASSLIGVVAQRLVRLICEHCKEEHTFTPDQKRLFRQLSGSDILPQIYRGRGCRHCNQTGYKGRIAIHEIVAVDSRTKELILERATADELRKAALERGMITMLQDGLNRMADGLTTFDEVLRVAYSL